LIQSCGVAAAKHKSAAHVKPNLYKFRCILS
jgi:hypothetical protein